MPNDAFEALKHYDWGTDLAVLAPIEDAVAAAHGKADALQDLESRLLEGLASDISRDAKDYVCRKLMVVGSATSVPVLAALLPNPDHSHMARYALERIPGPEAAEALRDALSKVTGNLKIGVISSLGARRDAGSVATLGALLGDDDVRVVRAAALALGEIGTFAAAEALGPASKKSGEGQQAVVDAMLVCAEALLADRHTADARAIYQALAGDEQSRLIRLAATRGLLACAAKAT